MEKATARTEQESMTGSMQQVLKETLRRTNRIIITAIAANYYSLVGICSIGIPSDAECWLHIAQCTYMYFNSKEWTVYLLDHSCATRSNAK